MLCFFMLLGAHWIWLFEYPSSEIYSIESSACTDRPTCGGRIKCVRWIFAFARAPGNAESSTYLLLLYSDFYVFFSFTFFIYSMTRYEKRKKEVVNVIALPIYQLKTFSRPNQNRTVQCINKHNNKYLIEMKIVLPPKRKNLKGEMRRVLFSNVDCLTILLHIKPRIRHSFISFQRIKTQKYICSTCSHSASFTHLRLFVSVYPFASS